MPPSTVVSIARARRLLSNTAEFRIHCARPTPSSGKLVIERKSDGTMHLVRVSGNNSRGQSDTCPRVRYREFGGRGENPGCFDNFDGMLDRGPRQRRFTGRLGDKHLHRLKFGERTSELVSRKLNDRRRVEPPSTAPVRLGGGKS
jgi:hypothetical protein